MAAPAVAATSVSQCLRALAIAAGLCACAAHAQEIPPPAYQLAAQLAGIPSTVLYAVALQESGIRRNGRIVPWPWSLNVAGQSHRFATRADACAGLQQAMRSTSHTRIDAGLGQINLGYHQQRYVSACDLLDPYRNLAIAAEILKEQHVTGEDWLLAIGRYHRPAGGEPAARYRRSVSRHLARVQGTRPTAAAFAARQESIP
ncbi:transglycosylase SLT domain-containing protein [Pseudomonas aeruginosa]|uniref:Lytic transglycosylase domain-containing protein n=1 Tax=Alcaligenes aquatilis TaxID=323284 RepID=A0A3G2HRT3_9BURK|nr:MULTISPECIES: transglycosylase SLT domain-containing protein [Pseudomonadota]AID83395.1 lytic transglycosylase [Pseudomonas aeruginosa VRFPA04]MCH2556995.1 transglycosylase SLT domain-containing protein [Alcanivorax sp.]AYN19631.1 lytic transglycosylase domain-containing protein [Alcaligenes aquatilis]EKZ9454272.1 transglycosylase SLT domain-containing protein [Pseudomonas aeruginosa]ELJ3077131.1 transglycosylase SLT domain-containing protein [Pseudomonas aeruginosa]